MSNGIMDNPGDAKYGFTTEQLFEGFKILKEKGAKNFGIHAFLASNTVTNEYYPMLAKQLFEVAVKMCIRDRHIAGDFGYIILGFFKWRNSTVFCYVAAACIVGGKSKGGISVVFI